MKTGPSRQEIFDLLKQVFNGEYSHFRAMLNQNNIRYLDLEDFIDMVRRTSTIHFSHLGEGLKYTCVNSLVISKGIANNNEAVDLFESLAKTEICSLYISENKLNLSELGNSLVSIIPNTCIIELDLATINKKIKEIIDENKYRKIMLPYAISCLAFSEDDMNKYADLTKTINPTPLDEHHFASGIYINADEDVRNQILAKFPLMNLKGAEAYQKISKEFHADNQTILLTEHKKATM